MLRFGTRRRCRTLLFALRFLPWRLWTLLLLNALRCLALLRHRALLGRLAVELWRALQLSGGLGGGLGSGHCRGALLSFRSRALGLLVASACLRLRLSRLSRLLLAWIHARGLCDLRGPCFLASGLSGPLLFAWLHVRHLPRRLLARIETRRFIARDVLAGLRLSRTEGLRGVGVVRLGGIGGALTELRPASIRTLTLGRRDLLVLGRR